LLPPFRAATRRDGLADFEPGILLCFVPSAHQAVSTFVAESGLLDRAVLLSVFSTHHRFTERSANGLLPALVAFPWLSFYFFQQRIAGRIFRCLRSRRQSVSDRVAALFFSRQDEKGCPLVRSDLSVFCFALDCDFGMGSVFGFYVACVADQRRFQRLR